MGLNKEDQKQFNYLNKKSKTSEGDVLEHMDQWGDPTLKGVIGTVKYVTGFRHWGKK